MTPEQYLQLVDAKPPGLLSSGYNPPSFPGVTPQQQQMLQNQPQASVRPRAQGILGGIMGALQGAGKAIYGDDDITRLRRQNAFQAMTLNPNQALIAANQRQMEYLQGQELMKNQASRTAEWLRGMNTDVSLKYANYLEQNPDADVANVLKMWDAERRESAEDTETIKTRKIEAGALGYLPGSAEYNEYIAQGEGAIMSKDEKVSTENNLRNTFRRDLDSFLFFDIRDGFETVKSFYENPGEVSDYALTVAFLKVLDPGSVVRGEEVDALNRAQAALPAFGSELENALFGGGKLSDTVRNEIAKLAVERFSIAARNANSLKEQYKAISDRYGLNLDSIAVNAYIPDAEIDIVPIGGKAGEMIVLPEESQLDMSKSNVPYYNIMLRWPTLNNEQRNELLGILRR